MSRINQSICCSRCGRYLYVPLTSEELRQVGYAKRISNYYVINDNGKEEKLCKPCYKAWKKEAFDDLDLLKNTDKENRICSKCHIIATSDFCERCGGKSQEEYEYVYIGNGAYEKRPKVKSEPTTENNLGTEEITALAEYIERLAKANDDAYHKGYTDCLKAQTDLERLRMEEQELKSKLHSMDINDAYNNGYADGVKSVNSCPHRMEEENGNDK